AIEKKPQHRPTALELAIMLGKATGIGVPHHLADGDRLPAKRALVIERDDGVDPKYMAEQDTAIIDTRPPSPKRKDRKAGGPGENQ
ncbi:hypothetical protein ACFLU6_11700, partial [Acidobacteriota bacterium]